MTILFFFPPTEKFHSLTLRHIFRCWLYIHTRYTRKNKQSSVFENYLSSFFNLVTVFTQQLKWNNFYFLNEEKSHPRCRHKCIGTHLMYIFYAGLKDELFKKNPWDCLHWNETDLKNHFSYSQQQVWKTDILETQERITFCGLFT